MKILKRNGTYEKLSFDKILYRIRKLANDKSLGVLKTVDPDIITQKVVKSIYDGISSWELDEEAARISVGMTENQEYPKLAARLVVSNLHKSTIECFSEVMEMLYEYTDESSGRNAGFISDEVMEVVRKHKDTLNYCMDFSRDYSFDYFGFKTLERSYLLKINKRIKVGDSYINKMVVVERPQHMYLRVALGLFRDDIPNVLKTYDLISRGLFTFASPTLFNSGLKLGQLSSCFTEDTLVSTVNRGPIPIKDVNIGDLVITHRGNVKPVVQKHKNPLANRKLYEIAISSEIGLSSEKIKVTGNHRVWVAKRDNEFDWVAVSNLDQSHLFPIKGDLVSFTIKEISDQPEYVYTLGVEDDHSYTLKCGIIAENCFLLGTEDSLSGIFKTITDCAKISKVAGGIGVHVSNIRSKGSLIRGTHGTSDGIIPMLKVYNDVSLYVNQCLVPETIVYSRRGPLMMKEVEVGDDLITSDGTFQTVQKIFTNEKVDDDLVCISVKLNEADSVDLKCTSVHYILVQVGGNTEELLYVSASDILEYFNNGISVKMFFPSTSHLEFTDFIVRTEPHKRALKRLQSISGTQLLEITNVTTFRYSGLVYDFTVNWNHNYLTEGGIVHNSGKRKGSIAIYLEPWNGDIYEFLDLKKNQGHDNVRARDLFYALWIPDLFMKRVEEDADWYLMCPDECPGLHDSYGDKFEELYNKYIEEGRYKKKVRAQDLWFKILEAQIETGTPYMLYKDAANRKSNQRAYGTIRSSNLCVHGDTLVLTDNGYHKIAELEGSKVNVWNGWEWSSTTIYKTGENQKLLRVKLSDGSELKCTPYHKFYNADKEVITAENLKCGTELLTPKRFPVINNSFGPKGYYYCPYTNGYICGESQFSQIASDGGSPMNDGNASNINDGSTNEGIPINESIVTRLQWLDGFFDGYKLAGHTGLTFKVKSVRLLTQLRLLLNTLGISPNIKLNNDSDGSWHDSRGSCNDSHGSITFTERHIQQLLGLGLRIKPTKGDSNLDVPPLRVVSVEDTREYADTFCFTEEKRGMGIFNGILTGQCSEIILYSDSKETSVCNLSSIALPKFVNKKKKTIDWEGLKETARYIVKGMNRVIDVNYYSVPEAEYANKKHRPIGIGVQGLNDLFILMRYPFESEMARKLNREVFEAIYYGCVEGSIDEAEVSGPYETYNQSPMAEGKLQFDLWGEEDPKYLEFLKDSRWDWDALKDRLKKVGIRNCMLTTCMPTASTAQILGNTECIEPIDSCIFKRRVLSGDFTVINKYLVEDLQNLGLWSNEMKERIILNNGSIQAIQEIPDDIKALYKTVWEISQKTLIEYSEERGPFIDHSQSLNLFVENPTIRKLSSMHFYGWKRGLKTGMYYLRSKSSSGAAKFSVDASLEVAQKGKAKKEYTEEEKLACSLENREACEACSG